jgi:hypothetical protein
MSLNVFAGWAFGYKFLDAHLYSNPNYKDSNTVLFSNNGNDNYPTAQFYQVAETNRQSRNLGPALVRLISTDVRMIMGKHGTSGTTNATPSGVGNNLDNIVGDSYLKSASVTAHPSGINNNQPGDVIIGFFKPLHEAFDGDNYSNQSYFMVVNGLSDATATSSATQQTIRLTFNFGSSAINSLQRLSRSTGTVEVVSLVSDGNGAYHLDLTLDGGTGDLFKYNTGAPFVGFYTNEVPCLEVTPVTQTVGAAADTATFTVSNTGSGSMAWTASVTSSSSWLTITSGASGTNSGSIVVSFTKNTVPVTRSATVTVIADGATNSPIEVTVTQSAADLIPGDANKDGMVDVGDLGILAANYGGSNKTWAMGDFNNDGIVDVGDLGILAANYGKGSSTSGMNFDADYAKVFGTTDSSMISEESADDDNNSICTSLGLSLVAGLAMLGLMIVKLEE